jgi:radical SAM protein with 4Fe4S-binding SPASM domain
MKTIKLRRLLNKALAFAANQIRPSRTINKPFYAIFEMSNRCTLNCALCNTGGLKERFRHIDRGTMSFETFKAGLDKLLPEIDLVMLHNWGEPLLNPNLFRCIEYSSHHQLNICLSSNLMMYNENIGRRLVETGLTKLIVSADGLHQETYEKYRRGGDLSRVSRAVENMIDLKNSKNSPIPKIEMQFIVFKHNEHEMEEYESYWKEKGVDSVRFIRMSFMSGEGRAVATELDLIPNNPDFKPHDPYGTVRKCHDLYSHVSIDWNGDWYTCCFPSGEKIYRMGNIVDDDFWSIWNGEKYIYCRRLVRTGKSQGNYTETMCHDCTGVYPKGETKNYWK